jgi:ATP-dependent Clp protease adaptor protein ClpS
LGFILWKWASLKLNGPKVAGPVAQEGFQKGPAAISNHPALIGCVGLETALMTERKQGDQGTGIGTGVVTEVKTKTQRPSLYRVLLLNDDYTPMEFVVYVLERHFNKSREDATRIMLHVHQHGVGVCGVFTYEVAETKVAQVTDLARRHQHPLQCTMEKD